MYVKSRGDKIEAELFIRKNVNCKLTIFVLITKILGTHFCLIKFPKKEM